MPSLCLTLLRRLYDLPNFLGDHIQRARRQLYRWLPCRAFLFSAGSLFSVTGSSSYGVQKNMTVDIGARLMAIEFFLVSHSLFLRHLDPRVRHSAAAKLLRIAV